MWNILMQYYSCVLHKSELYVRWASPDITCTFKLCCGRIFWITYENKRWQYINIQGGEIFAELQAGSLHQRRRAASAASVFASGSTFFPTSSFLSFQSYYLPHYCQDCVLGCCLLIPHSLLDCWHCSIAGDFPSEQRFHRHSHHHLHPRGHAAISASPLSSEHQCELGT